MPNRIRFKKFEAIGGYSCLAPRRLLGGLHGDTLDDPVERQGLLCLGLEHRHCGHPFPRGVVGSITGDPDQLIHHLLGIPLSFLERHGDRVGREEVHEVGGRSHTLDVPRLDYFQVAHTVIRL